MELENLQIGFNKKPLYDRVFYLFSNEFFIVLGVFQTVYELSKLERFVGDCVKWN